MGPYLETKIDFQHEGTQLGVNALVLNDIALKCELLNEKVMADAPVKFLKFRIGQIRINIQYTTVHVSIQLSDIQIDLLVCEQQNDGRRKSQQKPAPNDHTNCDSKEEYLVDRLFFSKLLQNLELSISSIAVRVVLQDSPLEDSTYLKPTLLFRVNAFSLLQLKEEEQHQEQPQTAQRVTDLQRVFGNKQISFSDISVHLMKDSFLSLSEDILAMQQAGHFSSLTSMLQECSFPFQYPFLNHPSTIFLMKAPKGADIEPVSLNDRWFSPSLTVSFKNTGPKENPQGSMSIECRLPLAECTLSFTQIRVLHTTLKPLMKPSNAENMAQKHLHGNPNDLMKSVLDFSLMEGMAGIEGVDIDVNNLGEADESLELQQELKQILQKQKSRRKSQTKLNALSSVRTCLEVGQFCFQLICHDDSKATQESDRVFKAMGYDVVQEFVPVGGAKCPWYELSLAKLSGIFNYETQKLPHSNSCQENLNMTVSLGQISLRRLDLRERKVKVQLGGNIKQTNPLARKDYSIEDSDDQSNFQSCLSSVLESSHYQMAQEFNESMDCSEMFFDATHTLNRINSEPHSLKKPIQLVNNFTFYQLTNVLRYQDIDQTNKVKGETELHLCSQPVFELVHLQGDQHCFTTSVHITNQTNHIGSNTTQTQDVKVDVKVGKVYLTPSLPDILTLLLFDALFATKVEIKKEAIFIPNLTHLESSSVSQGCESKINVEISASVDAVEIEIASYHQMAENAALMYKLEAQAPIQDLLHTVGCSCPYYKEKADQSSLNINLGKICVRSNREDLILQIATLEVLGRLGKEKVIPLLSADHLVVKQERQQNQEPVGRLQKLVSLDQIVEELRDEESKQAQPICHEPMFVHTGSGNDLVASKSSSLEKRVEIGTGCALSKHGIFDMESPSQRPSISVKRLSIRLDQAETKQLVTFAAMEEAFFKTVMNAADISNVKKIERTVDQADRQRYFDAKRKQKGAPLSILLEIDDIHLQVFTVGKPKASEEILKARLGKVAFSIRFQDRGLLTNIRLGMRVQDLMLIDKAQTVCMNYQPHAKVAQEGPHVRPDNLSSSFQEELEHHSQFLLVHPAYVRSNNYAALQDSSEVPRQDRKVLKALIDIAFINKSFFEERTTSKTIANKLDQLKANRPVVIIYQMAQDFADLKTNPMQLKVQFQLQNLVIPTSSQNLRLQTKLKKLGEEFQSALLKFRDPNMRDVVQDPACKPPQEFVLLEKQRFEVDITDITVLYTPVLKRQQAEQILFIRPDFLAGQFVQDAETKVRMPYCVALSINQLRLKSNRSVAIAESGPQSFRPKAKHLIENQSLVVHFLHKKTLKIWPDDLVQGKSLLANMRQVLTGFDVIQDDQYTQEVLTNNCTTIGEELAFRGFIPLLSILETKINARSSCFHFAIGSLTVSLAGDSLRHFMDFCKLVQLSMVDELKQLEQFEEEISDLSISQTDSLALSAYHRFEHQNALKLSIQSQQHKLEHEKLAYLKEISQSAINNPGEIFDCNPNPYFSKGAQEQSEIVTMLSKSQASTYAEIQSEIFIVDGEAPHGQVQQPKRSKNPFAKSISPPSTQQSARPNLNIAALIQDDYFAPILGHQEEKRFRRIHQREFEPQTKDKFCSFEFTFELSLITVQVHDGKDFDFDLTPPPFKTFEGLGKFNQVRRISQSQALEKSAVNSKPFDLEDNYFAKHSNAEQQLQQLLIQDVKQSITQKRSSTRKSSDFMRLQLQDLLLSRRQYPDKALMQVLAREKQLRQEGVKSEVPKVGRKLKTLGLSLRTLQVQLSAKGHRLQSLFNHPYHFRFHNLFEFKDYSERSYQDNVEEHQVHLFLRPTHITLSQEPINFLMKILPDPNPQQVMQDQQDFILLEYTMGVQAPKQPAAELKHVIKHLIIKESSLTISVAGVFSKYIQVRDLTLMLKEFKLNCSGLTGDHFYSEVLDESIQLVTDQNDVQSLPFDEALNRVVFFYRNDIVANQKLAIISGFRPIQAIKYAGGSLLSPLYKPLYKAYHMGYLGLVFGLREGVQDFYGLLQHGSKGMAILALKQMSKL